MQFERRKLLSPVGTEQLFKDHAIIKVEQLGNCACCGAFTRWQNDAIYLCGEECLMVYEKARESGEQTLSDLMEERLSAVRHELSLLDGDNNQSKDIIIVVRDQLSFVKDCLESVQQHTRNYRLFLWDNGSRPETAAYLRQISNAYLVRSETNQGFILPNNDLAAKGNSKYIILLNSDTKVFENWADLMVAYLQEHPTVAEVGYQGGLLDENAIGAKGGLGYDVDYVAGWCICISRATYEQFGLFSEDLAFAYAEDADLSIRLQEAGKQIYALASPFVTHFGNQTIKAVQAEGQINIRQSFEQNHATLRSRWPEYLAKRRVEVRKALPTLG